MPAWPSLHLVAMAPYDASEPAAAAQTIVAELERFSPALAARERWLILNKVDMLDPEQVQEVREKVVRALDWQGPIYEIAAINGQGTEPLCYDIMEQLEQWAEAEAADPDLAEQEQETQRQSPPLVTSWEIEALREQHRLKKQARESGADDDDDDFDDDVEVEYVP